MDADAIAEIVDLTDDVLDHLAWYYPKPSHESDPTGHHPRSRRTSDTRLHRWANHPFAESTKYDLIYEGKAYPPKAIIGLASKYAFGEMLIEFSGGEGVSHANGYLEKLGFEIRAKTDSPIAEPQIAAVKRGADWTDNEINLIVADYFAMLGQELAGQQFNKTAHRAALSPRLNGRSNGSVEFKHQNISGVLVDLGLPYITGYKPRGNYQRRLSEIVDQYLISHPNLLTDFSNSRVLDPVAPPTIGTIIPSPRI